MEYNEKEMKETIKELYFTSVLQRMVESFDPKNVQDAEALQDLFLSIIVKDFDGSEIVGKLQEFMVNSIVKEKLKNIIFKK